ncbi:hypothetical protein AVEN_271595-1 [Araneus ventricosus]|uniref:Uncharacterized protein n=1 Tax=Araneus ventricosus TaxID=182803 RepID=A0A4Y2NF84_ARAVE|nr:hypothetical protein AVEN_271595-1 [Araneus ventricosus]
MSPSTIMCLQFRTPAEAAARILELDGPSASSDIHFKWFSRYPAPPPRCCTRMGLLSQYDLTEDLFGLSSARTAPGSRLIPASGLFCMQSGMF